MEKYLDLLRDQFGSYVSLERKRPNIYTIKMPVYHEDGDMVDIYLEERRNGNIRICDYGMTLMRLSYEYDINTDAKQKVLANILSENMVTIDDGNLYIDTVVDDIYPSIMQLSSTILKVSNFRYFKRTVIASMFYDNLKLFIEEKLGNYQPEYDFLPIKANPEYKVDYVFQIRQRPIYLFGISGNDKANYTTICCQRFQLEDIKFIGLAVHENFGRLSSKPRDLLTNAIGKQFTDLDKFKSDGPQYIDSLVA